ncbi:MAG: hypothetical protein V2A76_01545 [Planctomycetota bacterium]
MKSPHRCCLLVLSALALNIPALAGEPLERSVSPEGGVEPVVSLYGRTLTVQRAQEPAIRAPAAVSGFLSTDSDPEGDMPREVAFLPNGTAAVIANRDTDTVTFFDVATRAITHTVGVGDFPVDVQVTPNGQYALVPCVFDNQVYVIDVATHSVAAQVPVTGAEPYRVEITGNGLFAVVGVVNDAVNSALSVIDLATLTEVRSIPSSPQGALGFFFSPESGAFGNIFTQFAVSSDNSTVLLPDRSNGTVERYDLTTGASTATMATAALPTAIDISTDGTLAVVSHEGSTQRISLIDLATSTVTGSFATGDGLYNQVVRITPDKSHAMAAILNGVIFLNLTSGTVAATLSTGTVGDIEFSYDGQFAYVSNYNSRIISLATRSIVRTITYYACAEAAASPVEHRVVALNNRFSEDVLLFNINGVSGFAEGLTGSGEPDEGDATRTLAITPDGSKVVAANNLSRNATVIDLESGRTGGYPAAGTRPLGVAVSPDGLTAVVANGDNDTVSVIDLTTETTVAQLPVSSRPGEVLISPDSQWAYVTTVAGTDRVHFIQLAGAASSVVGSLVTGQMGSIGYTYNVLSGMALSEDGSVLVVCISFDDQLMVVDTASRTEIARLPTGDFPIRARFVPGGSFCYVTNSFSDNVSVFSIDLASQTAVTTVPNIEFPLTITPDSSGAFVYIGSFDFNNPNVAVIGVNAGHLKLSQVGINSPPRAAHYSAQTGRLYVAATDGELVRINAAGAASSVIDATPLAGSPADMVFREFNRTAVCAQPGEADGVDLIRFDDECGSITAYGVGCAGGGGFVPAASLTGCAAPSGQLLLGIEHCLGGSTAIIVFGTGRAAQPLNGCLLNVAPLLPLFPTLPLDGVGPGQGTATLDITIPSGMTGLTVTTQVFAIDPGVTRGWANSNGIELVIL